MCSLSVDKLKTSEKWILRQTYDARQTAATVKSQTLYLSQCLTWDFLYLCFVSHHFQPASLLISLHWTVHCVFNTRHLRWTRNSFRKGGGQHKNAYHTCTKTLSLHCNLLLKLNSFKPYWAFIGLEKPFKRLFFFFLTLYRWIILLCLQYNNIP